MEIVQGIWLLIGIVLIIFGRQLYWLSVGALGFLVGAYLIPQYIHFEQEWMTLAAAVFVGILIAVLTYVLQKIALGVVGLLLGGYLTILLLNYLQIEMGNYFWIAVLLGGIIGAVFITVLFDYTLIVLSSAAGAILVVQNIPLALEQLFIGLLFIVLTVAGISIQSTVLRRK